MGRKRKNLQETEVPSLSVSPSSLIFENPIDDYQYYRGDRNVPKSEAQFEWTPKMVQELKKCKEDIVYFAENYFYIVNLDRGKEVIKLYTRQRQILKSLVSSRYTCVLSCRQAGKSTLMTIYALWMACFDGNQEIFLVGADVYNPDNSPKHKIISTVAQVMRVYSQHQFRFVTTTHTAPESWQELLNFQTIQEREFISYCDIS
jgi:hypothetical protein